MEILPSVVAMIMVLPDVEGPTGVCEWVCEWPEHRKYYRNTLEVQDILGRKTFSQISLQPLCPPAVRVGSSIAQPCIKTPFQSDDVR